MMDERGLLGAGSGVAHSPLPAPSGSEGEELDPLLPPTAQGRSIVDGSAPVPGAGDVAADSDGQLVLSAPEFRKGQVAA